MVLLLAILSVVGLSILGYTGWAVFVAVVFGCFVVLPVAVALTIAATATGGRRRR